MQAFLILFNIKIMENAKKERVARTVMCKQLSFLFNSRNQPLRLGA